MNSQDTLFAQPRDTVSGFVFDESVADVFADMIQRSVPGYTSVIAMSGFLAQRFAQPATRIYDLGCSLGATSLAMLKALSLEQRSCELVAVDNSVAMLDRAAAVLAEQSKHQNTRFECADINEIEVDNASLIAMNYTLQFIDPQKRQNLLDHLAQGLIDGGVLILSEKIAFEDPAVNRLFIELHHDFKRSQGYSDLEIGQKRAALEEVLIPEPLETHKQRLLDAGFARVEPWFQCLNFASLVAFK